jgi:multiple sugar transport system permease protein
MINNPEVRRLIRKGRKYALIVLGILVCAVYLLPVAWMIITSLKPSLEIFSIPPKWIFQPVLENYKTYFQQGEVIRRYINTIVVATSSATLSVLVGSLAGYAVARLKIRGATFVGVLILGTRAIPPITMVIPFYLLARTLGAFDKPITLIVSYMTFMVPYVVWLSRGFFLALPSELEDAARIDGCSYYGAFFRVILPNALPGLLATLIFCMILAWNELLFAMILTRREAGTIPVLISGLVSNTDEGAMWGPLTAVGTMTMVPVILFALLVQKHLVGGMSAGASLRKTK